MSDFFERELRKVNGTPLDESLFLELVEVVLSAMAGKLRVIPPDAERCMEEAPPGSLFLTDCPENQIGMAIVRECRDRFGSEKGKRIAQSFLYRWVAFLDAKEDGLLGAYIKPTPDGRLFIHDAIFKAAASSRLTQDGGFEMTPFLARIREIVASEESEGD